MHDVGELVKIKKYCIVNFGLPVLQKRLPLSLSNKYIAYILVIILVQ